MPRAAAPPVSPSELRSMIVELVSRSDERLALRKIRSGLPRAYRPADEELRKHLDALVRAGTLHEWPRRRYGSRSVDDVVTSAIISDALGVAEITKATGIPRTTVSRVLTRLVRSGAVHEHPKEGRQRRYSMRPPSVRELVEPKLLELVAKLEKDGIRRSDAMSAIAAIAAPTSRGNDPLLQAISDLDPKRGALVYIPHLRTAVADQYTDKNSFDRAMLVLFAQRKVEMQSHPTPAALSAREKELMIEDGRGSYYSAVALR